MSFYTSRPLDIGHRGAPEAAPENTLAAFEAARQMGADGVELDVLLTADGVPVVCHNLTVDKTTNGTGCIRDLTVEQIKALDAGSWFHSRFAGERIPTLQEVLEWAGRDMDMLLNPEIQTGLLCAPALPIPLRRAWLHPLARPNALHPHHTMVTPGYLQWARNRGYHVNTWTVNEPAEMRRLTRLGVDIIITDRPNVLHEVLSGKEDG